MMKVKKRSIIKKYFTDEIYLELMKITMIPNVSNNVRGQYVKELLRSYNIPFESLGSGTNRLGVQIDGYAFKFALDMDGMIDSRKEMKYTQILQPYVVKVYECTPNGLIMCCEVVEIFTIDDFHERQDEMREILDDISKSYLIGDVGITSKNYVNWGKRLDGSICILDFAYIYDVSFNTFKCECDDESLLTYDNNYVDLICPTCGRKFNFGYIRKRIARKQQENEIGDIRTCGYCLTKDNEEVEMIPEFEPESKKNKTKKPKNPVAVANKQHRKELKEMKEEEKLYY